MTSKFTDLITNAADSLFVKNHKSSTTASFSQVSYARKERAAWYDNDCKAKKSVLKDKIHIYNRLKSAENRADVFKARKDYKFFCRKQKNKFQRDRCKQMDKIRRENPKEFWNFFQQKSTRKETDITLNQFFNHFQELASNGISNEDDEAEDFLNNFDTNRHENESLPSFDELDKQITHDEIKHAIRNIKRNKSPGRDELLNEYFIECCDLLIEPLEILFNTVLDSGCFPSRWTEGIIIPLHKKGPTSDTTIYRGITLISCLGKLFTSVINRRLINWSTENEISTDAQFGFKANHSTVDAIFVLQNLINMYLKKKQKLYCAFIDLKRAFDTVYRHGLWYKMIKYGIDGKLIKLLRNMYSKVKSCVRHLNCLSDFFNSDIGLFQGEIMSPFLFSLFINDVEISLQANMMGGITLDQITIFLLLFADDAVLISDSKQGLQNSLTHLETYCNKWKLTINVEKTKIMIFQKGGRLPQETFTLYGKNVEVVKEFNYLGYTVSCGGSFQKAINILADKAVRAMGLLFSTIRKIQIPFKMLLQLFDTYVKSILSYSCEVWGFLSADRCERVHRKYLKRILGVKISTNNLALYGETGRFPLFLDRHVRILKYWLKIARSDYNNCIVKAMYTCLLDEMVRNENVKNWVTNVKNLLQRSGFHDVWLYPDSVIDIKFIPIFRTRIR
ncbi:MAG: reverse transcriptase family protein, partial [Candidatus Thiodiazotropha endolucinida]|nr:reverse transcriptase family protein [Candidatus Thiodiazotropha taylori]MCW4346806.1 reverse transcriptase family protein [Candidatus Thiodiazotropha endolucinida]